MEASGLKPLSRGSHLESLKKGSTCFNGGGGQPPQGQVEFIRSYFKALVGIKKSQTLLHGWGGGGDPESQ